MPPQSRPDASSGDVLAGLARLEALFGALQNQVNGVGSDAREARDVAMELKTQLQTEGLPAQMTALRGDMNIGLSSIRTDMEKAYSRMREAAEKRVGEIDAELSVHNSRIDALEAWRDGMAGERSVWKWVASHAPWIIGIIAASTAVPGGEMILSLLGIKLPPHP